MNEYEEEFKAVKTIMDAVFKFWPRLSPTPGSGSSRGCWRCRRKRRRG